MFVGAETGILKGVNVNNKASISKNFHNLSSLEKQFEITSLSFGDTENEILLGLRNQTVKVYDIQYRSFSESMDCSTDTEGQLVGVARVEGTLITASRGGALSYWTHPEPVQQDALGAEVETRGKLRGGEMEEDRREQLRAELRTGLELTRMRQCPAQRTRAAVAGKEVELQVWDLTEPATPTWRARNVPADSLCLRRPVWVSDLAWTGNTTTAPALCSRHGDIRLYDTRAQRRPVVELGWAGEESAPPACTAIAAVGDHQVVIGTSTGQLGLFDWRAGAGSYRGLVRKLGGCVGAVRSLATSGDNRHCGAVGLDRFLRVWDLGPGGKKPTHKLYLKSRLNCILMTESFRPEQKEVEGADGVDKECGLDDSVEILDHEQEEDQKVLIPKAEDDDLWDSMVVIDSGAKRKKPESNLSRKKLK